MKTITIYFIAILSFIGIQGFGQTPNPATDMIIHINTNHSAGTTMSLPLQGTVNVVVNWGDGTLDTITTAGNPSHTYAAEGVYTIGIRGSLTQFGGVHSNMIRDYYNYTGAEKIDSVTSWGNMGIISLRGAFPYGYNGDKSNIIKVPDSLPQNVNDLAFMFYSASSFNYPLNSWNVSMVTDMSFMFCGATSFDQPLNSWDVSSVHDMRCMFSYATSFNQNINSWNVSTVTEMGSMFNHASSFNQPLNSWNVSSVTNMAGYWGGMFEGASSFNQPLNTWDVSSVTNMGSLFSYATSFNQNIDSWDVSSVTNMAGMFSYTDSFNQPLNSWDVSSVVSMGGMFAESNAFNQPLNSWDVSSVVDMGYMFFSADLFEKSISTWDVSSVTNMSYMFYEAISFNQPLNSWDVSSVTSMEKMFAGYSYATPFNQPINSWDVSAVTNMAGMFMKATSFNQTINNWNVGSVTNLEKMFFGASSFNQPLNTWDVSSVINMEEMFSGATLFNQPLLSWDVSKVSNMKYMFSGATSYSQSIALWDISSVIDMFGMFHSVTLPTNIYSTILTTWSKLSVKNNVRFHSNSKYHPSVVKDRNILINNYNWTILDGGMQQYLNDVAIEIAYPNTGGVSPGADSIVIDLINYGSNALTSTTLKYTVNGGTAQSYAWTGNLASMDTLEGINIGMINQSVGSVNIVVWGESPNGATDGYLGNDTAYLTINILPAPLTLSGKVTIKGKTDHSGIRVISKRTNPSLAYDTTYTDAQGNYSMPVDSGMVNVYFSKGCEVKPDSVLGINAYSTVVVPDHQLDSTLSGNISGTLAAGDYFVGCDLIVDTTDALTLSPGTRLYFYNNSRLLVYGNLYANGTAQDSIAFVNHTPYDWHGIKIYNTGSDTIEFSYAKISGSTARAFESSRSIILNHCLIEKNNVNDIISGLTNTTGGAGAFSVSSSITNCTFKFNKSPYELIGLSGNIVFSGNLITNNISNNYLFLASYSNSNVVNNIFFENFVHNNYFGERGGVQSELNSSHNISNNLFINNQAAIAIMDRGNTLISNNIFDFNNSYNTKCINIWGGVQDIKNNVFYTQKTIFHGISNANLGILSTTNSNGDSTDIYGNLFTNPLLVDAPNFDFHLQASSPCIDAGNNLVVTTAKDIENNNRVFDGNYDGIYTVDIGPFEYSIPFVAIHDLVAQAWNAPYNANGFYTANEQVKVQVYNAGTVADSNFLIYYSLDNGSTWVVDTFNQVLTPYSTAQFTFTQTANLSTVGTYSCKFKIDLVTDTNINNNLLSKSLPSNSYNKIDGFATIQGETNHAGIRVILKQISPSTSQDTVYTASNGYYEFYGSPGNYEVYFIKPCESTPDTLYNQSCFNVINTLPSVSLFKTLSGNLSGTLAQGTYYIGCDVTVQAGDSLIIEPGTEMLFFNYAELVIRGKLIAQGTAQDSILFSRLYSYSPWDGISFRYTQDSSILNYCIIEGSVENAMTVFSSIVILDNSTVKNNSHSYEDDDIGNGSRSIISVIERDGQKSNLYIYRSILTENTAILNYNGSIVYTDGWNCKIDVYDSHIIYNVTYNKVFFAIGGNINIYSSFIENNTGDVLVNFVGYGQYSIMYTKIANNSGHGLGSTSHGFIGSLTHCILFNNNAGEIAAVFPLHLDIRNSLIVNNNESIFSHSSDYYEFVVNAKNSIFINGSGNLFDLQDNSETINFSKCLFQNSGNLGTNPPDSFGLLTTINSNGDSTDVFGNLFMNPMLVDTANGDFHLTYGSPCIDAGSNLAVISTTDFDGNQRVKDGNGDQNAVVDIGLFEYQLSATQNDLAVLSLLTSSSCAENQSLKAVIRNMGQDTINTATINCQVNGTTNINNSYSGSLLSGAVDTVLINSSFSVQDSTIYLFQVYPTAVNGGSDGFTLNDTAYLTINAFRALPVIQWSAFNDFCEGETGISLNHASPAGGNYSGAGVSNDFFDPSLLTPGQSYIRYQVTDAHGCSSSDSTLITIHANPQINISAIPRQCRNGNPLNLNQNISPSGGVFYGAISNDSLFNPNDKNAGFHTLSYSVTDANGCEDSVSFTVEVVNQPAVAILSIPDTSLCINEQSINLTVWPLGGNFSGLGMSGNAFSPQVAGIGTSEIVYTFTDSNSCTNSDTAWLNVHPLPTVSHAALPDICAQSQPLSISGGMPSCGYYSGIYVNSSLGKFDVQQAGSGLHQIIYHFTDNYGCSNSDTVSQKVISVPTALFTLPSTVCISDTVQTIYNGISGSAAIFNWDFASANSINGSGYGPYSLAWDTIGLKQISLTVTDSGCTSQAFNQYINVLGAYAQIMSVGNTSVCYGDSVSFFANIGPGNSFQWYDTSGALPNDTLSYFVAGQTGSYYCVVTSPNGCPATSNSMSGVIRDEIIADFTLPPTTCFNDLVPITFTGIAPVGATYIWDFDQGTIGSGSGSGPYNLLWTSDSTKTVSLNITHNGCSSLLVSKDVYIFETPAVITAMGNTTLCHGQSLTLSANTGLYTYQWYKDGLPISGATNPLLIANQSGNYTVEVTSNQTSCSAMSDSLPVIVNIADFNLAFSANPTTFSSPPFLTNFLNQTPNKNNYYWQWNFGDGLTSNYVNPSHQYGYTGSYTVEMIAQSITTGCYDTLTKPNYIVCNGGSPCTLNHQVGSPDGHNVCPGGSIKIYSKEHSPGVLYQWLKYGILIPGATDSVFYATENGLYQVMVSDTICTVFSQPFSVNIYNTLTPVILTNGSIQPCSNDSVQLYVSTAFSNYLWSNGSTGSSIYVNSSGSYTVTVTDNNGCLVGSAPEFVNASYALPPQICIVGVDSATNHNRLVWERYTSSTLDSFKVYRETVSAGVYQPIAKLPFSQLSLFIDTMSNPAQQGYRYYLTGIDTCGIETAPSNIHKSIHLTINAGLNNTWNLMWSHYEGFSFGSYRIYRGLDTNNLQLITQIQSNLNSYTDLNPPTGNSYYLIELVSPHDCFPDSVYTKANTNYNASRSNHVSSNQAPNNGINKVVRGSVIVNLYPNPNDGRFTVEIAGAKQGKHIMEITNNLGQLLHSEQIEVNGSSHRQEVNMNHLPKGIYYLTIRNEDDKLVRKLIVK